MAKSRRRPFHFTQTVVSALPENSRKERALALLFLRFARSLKFKAEKTLANCRLIAAFRHFGDNGKNTFYVSFESPADLGKLTCQNNLSKHTHWQFPKTCRQRNSREKVAGCMILARVEACHRKVFSHPPRVERRQTSFNPFSLFL